MSKLKYDYSQLMTDDSDEDIWVNSKLVSSRHKYYSGNKHGVTTGEGYEALDFTLQTEDPSRAAAGTNTKKRSSSKVADAAAGTNTKQGSSSKVACGKGDSTDQCYCSEFQPKKQGFMRKMANTVLRFFTHTKKTTYSSDDEVDDGKKPSLSPARVRRTAMTPDSDAFLDDNWTEVLDESKLGSPSQSLLACKNKQHDQKAPRRQTSVFEAFLRSH